MTTSLATRDLQFDRIPSTVCEGFFDINGSWNKGESILCSKISVDPIFSLGFICPINNRIQYFCCGSDRHQYCCSSDRYSFERAIQTSSSSIQVESFRTTSTMISKQFELFQRYFLPIFLLTTTILFLVGIALWFWLYKQKSLYSLGQDDLIESRLSPPVPLTPARKKRNSINLTLDLDEFQLSRHLPTEV